MTGLAALDVVIGLVFIYSLYSLLVSLIQEIIATNFSFRAKILERAIVRMLEDESNKQRSVFSRLKSIFGLLTRSSQTSDGTLADHFYKQPLIKYLGEDKRQSKPAYLNATNFSEALLLILRPNFKAGDDSRRVIEDSLSQKLIDNSNSDTIRFLNSLWADAQGDVERFRELLEKWFDDTMLRATEWYKKYNQVYLLLIGLCIAIFFNVDTIQIVRKLSKDPKLRTQLVQRADAYMKDHPAVLEDVREQKERVDYLLQVKDTTASDSIAVARAEEEKEKIDSVYQAYVFQMKKVTSEADSLVKDDLKDVNNLLAIGWSDQCEVKCGCCKCSFLPNGLSWYSPIGWFLTALALSLGAPFWFDLLNKLMKLRAAVQTHSSPKTNLATEGSGQTKVKRVG
jgi:hypothetical protein